MCDAPVSIMNGMRRPSTRASTAKCPPLACTTKLRVLDDGAFDAGANGLDRRGVSGRAALLIEVAHRQHADAEKQQRTEENAIHRAHPMWPVILPAAHTKAGLTELRFRQRGEAPLNQFVKIEPHCPRGLARRVAGADSGSSGQGWRG